MENYVCQKITEAFLVLNYLLLLDIIILLFLF